MNLEPFYKILNKAMGLSPESLGRSGISHALSKRMRVTGCNEKSYLKLLVESIEEQGELVEEIVVPETWFFRDGKPFDLLFEAASKKGGEDFRVLSAPCSTGEEPYSVAMTLLAAGFDTSCFQVDGVDISRRSIEKARTGLFTENSFRTKLPAYALNCFQKCEGGRRLSDRILKSVDFHIGNILEGMLPSGKYDVIFCRNLLIYLDERHKRNLAEILSCKLKEDGLLFVGHAEILPVFNEWFTPVRRQGTFALKKGKRRVAALLNDPDSISFRPNEFSFADKRPAFSLRKDEVIPELTDKSRRQLADPGGRTAPLNPESMIQDVAEIRKIADLGKTSEALRLCEEAIEQLGPDADFFHLCGLLYEAQGNNEKAEEFYGKALYLEPRHLESLVHLALLLENRGEVRRAGLLRNRVRRAGND